MWSSPRFSRDLSQSMECITCRAALAEQTRSKSARAREAPPRPPVTCGCRCDQESVSTLSAMPTSWTQGPSLSGTVGLLEEKLAASWVDLSLPSRSQTLLQLTQDYKPTVNSSWRSTLREEIGVRRWESDKWRCMQEEAGRRRHWEDTSK